MVWRLWFLVMRLWFLVMWVKRMVRGVNHRERLTHHCVYTYAPTHSKPQSQSQGLAVFGVKLPGL